MRGNDLLSIDREARASPGSEPLDEAFGQALSLVETAQEELLEQLLDGLDVDEEERQELAVRAEDALGGQEVDVGMVVGRKRAEGLDGSHAAGKDILAVEVGLVGEADGVVGGTGEKAEELPLAPDQREHHHREHRQQRH